jgi:hypothetical protein
MRFNVENMMAALSRTENKVYRGTAESEESANYFNGHVKTVNYITLLRYCTDRDCMFNVLQ